MRIYFVSSVQAALKLGGVYVGILNKNEQFMDIDIKGNIFCEIIPADAKRLPVNFIIDENFLSSPPVNVEIYNLISCYKIAVQEFYSPTNKLKVVSQQKIGALNTVVTLFEENSRKLMIENTNGFLYEDLPSDFNISEIKTKEIGGDTLIIIEGRTFEKILIIVSEKQMKVVFKNIYDSYEFDKDLTVNFSFRDIAKHKAKSVWKYDKTFTMTDYEVNDDFNYSLIDPKLLPYCFFEEILCGGNPEKFLSGDLKAKTSDLKKYLGQFVDVISPPFGINQDYVGLVYRKADNLFTAKYFLAQNDNRLINNIVPLES